MSLTSGRDWCILSLLPKLPGGNTGLNCVSTVYAPKAGADAENVLIREHLPTPAARLALCFMPGQAVHVYVFPVQSGIQPHHHFSNASRARLLFYR